MSYFYQKMIFFLLFINSYLSYVTSFFIFKLFRLIYETLSRCDMSHLKVDLIKKSNFRSMVLIDRLLLALEVCICLFSPFKDVVNNRNHNFSDRTRKNVCIVDLFLSMQSPVKALMTQCITHYP